MGKTTDEQRPSTEGGVVVAQRPHPVSGQAPVPVTPVAEPSAEEADSVASTTSGDAVPVTGLPPADTGSTDSALETASTTTTTSAADVDIAEPHPVTTLTLAPHHGENLNLSLGDLGWFPEEVLLLILHHLSPRELCRVRHVCRTLHRIGSDISLFKRWVNEASEDYHLWAALLQSPTWEEGFLGFYNQEFRRYPTYQIPEEWVDRPVPVFHFTPAEFHTDLRTLKEQMATQAPPFRQRKAITDAAALRQAYAESLDPDTIRATAESTIQTALTLHRLLPQTEQPTLAEEDAQTPQQATPSPERPLEALKARLFDTFRANPTLALRFFGLASQLEDLSITTTYCQMRYGLRPRPLPPGKGPHDSEVIQAYGDWATHFSQHPSAVYALIGMECGFLLDTRSKLAGKTPATFSPWIESFDEPTLLQYARYDDTHAIYLAALIQQGHPHILRVLTREGIIHFCDFTGAHAETVLGSPLVNKLTSEDILALLSDARQTILPRLLTNPHFSARLIRDRGNAEDENQPRLLVAVGGALPGWVKPIFAAHALGDSLTLRDISILLMEQPENYDLLGSIDGTEAFLGDAHYYPRLRENPTLYFALRAHWRGGPLPTLPPTLLKALKAAVHTQPTTPTPEPPPVVGHAVQPPAASLRPTARYAPPAEQTTVPTRATSGQQGQFRHRKPTPPPLWQYFPTPRSKTKPTTRPFWQSALLWSSLGVGLLLTVALCASGIGALAGVPLAVKLLSGLAHALSLSLKATAILTTVVSAAVLVGSAVAAGVKRWRRPSQRINPSLTYARGNRTTVSNDSPHAPGRSPYPNPVFQGTGSPAPPAAPESTVSAATVVASRPSPLGQTLHPKPPLRQPGAASAFSPAAPS